MIDWSIMFTSVHLNNFYEQSEPTHPTNLFFINFKCLVGTFQQVFNRLLWDINFFHNDNSKQTFKKYHVKDRQSQKVERFPGMYVLLKKGIN